MGSRQGAGDGRRGVDQGGKIVSGNEEADLADRVHELPHAFHGQRAQSLRSSRVQRKGATGVRCVSFKSESNGDQSA